ncbi:MAG: DNA replication/repair protein RecF [Pseudomonadales bacterium]|nr:DNA replication/repair protein RecF [Pseudomonadales bacterium]
MQLVKLNTSGFRNLENTQLAFTRINFFLGVNGSGKSSILEMIQVLLSGKSFRANQLESCISHDLKVFTLYGEAKSQESDTHYKVGLSKEKDKLKILVDGEKVLSLASHAINFPVIVIDPTSFLLITEGPEGRRRFIDWGVFHVEHQFAKLWNRLKKVLKQRNALLRRGKISPSELNVWDQEFVRLSEQVNEKRRSYIEALDPLLNEYLKRFNINTDKVSCHFFQGWDAKKRLSDLLESGLDTDVKYGYTKFGPHRADIKFSIKGQPIDQVLSRGQLKLFVCALKVAQIKLLAQLTGKRAIILLDDFTSELDQFNQDLVFSVLEKESEQLFITALDSSLLLRNLSTPNDNFKMFHVEHGKITIDNSPD